VRIFGVPVLSPQALIEQTASDAGAVMRLVRGAPAQLDRLLELGEELVLLGHRMVDLAERLDARAEAITSLGTQLELRGAAIGALGERLDERAAALLELGGGIDLLGRQIDARGAEIVDRASRVVDTGNNLIVALPTLERALELATPLEGAIDRVGRFVDRLPGGANARRRPGGPDPSGDSGPPQP
jgi:hypothetical protein